jgi:hypothetical protein
MSERKDVAVPAPPRKQERVMREDTSLGAPKRAGEIA